jgi:GTPase SAR1 family protein
VSENFYKELDGAILIFDLGNPESFENIAKYKAELESKCEGISLILVGNKSDSGRQVTWKEAKEMADKLSIPFIETSAKSGRKVESTFDGLTSVIIEKREAVNPYVKPTSNGMCTIL